MGPRSANTKAGRGRGEVVPISDDDGQDSSYSPLDKPPRRESSHAPAAPRRRVLLTRGWLGFFLLLNIVAIAGFIFSSAWYFPATSTTGVVEQVIKQGDVSLLELPPRNESRGKAVGDSANEPGSVEPTTTAKPPTMAPMLLSQSSQPPQDPALEPTARLRGENESASIKMNPVTAAVAVVATQSPTIEPKQPSTDGDIRISTEALTSNPPSTNEKDTIDPHALAGAEAQQPLETTPPTTETVSSVTVVRSQSMEEILRRMKGTELPSALPKGEESAPAATEKPEDELVQEEQTAATSTLEEELGLEGIQIEETGPTEDEGLETNLVVWLKADAGVEIVNAVECEALGTACEVTSWKSVASPGTGSEPTVFQPVSSRMQPILQLVSQNELPMVSFSCGMVHTNGFVLHDMMTLFFVLSPSQIEAGDSYRAQKFFGNAPYGQFLMHGGRPAFFTASGLVESSVDVSNDQLVLMAYRLHGHAVEIKVGNHVWSPKQADEDVFQLRLSGNAALSLGNVKGVCDTNAFQGRIAEVLVYDTVLSDHRVGVVEQYLLQKWWGKTQPQRDDPDELIKEGTAGVRADPAIDEARISQDQLGSDQPQVTEQPRVVEETDQLPEDALESTMNPRAFDPEGVFEWLPSPELLALVAKEQGSDPSHLVEKWKQAVSEKVASVHSFQFGSDILRAFIRECRDELLTVREKLFGG